LLQRQQDLPPVVRFVRDEAAQQDDAGPVLDTLPALDDPREAPLDRAA
jgi:hypothetical protein